MYNNSHVLNMVWLGPLKKEQKDKIKHVQDMSKGYEFKLHTDDSELKESYRPIYNQWCKKPQSKSDLLRLSVLEKYGGWYLDFDVYLNRQLIDIVEYIDIKKYNVPRMGGMLNPDILYCPKDWKHWDFVERYVLSEEYIHDGKFSILAFANRMYRKMSTANLDINVLGSTELWPYRHEDITEKSLIIRKNLVQQNGMMENFLEARRRWNNEGRPYRDIKEVEEIYDKHCAPCEHFTGQGCKVCGCFISRSRKHFNKLAWATEKCPVGKWGGESSENKKGPEKSEPKKSKGCGCS